MGTVFPKLSSSVCALSFILVAAPAVAVENKTSAISGAADPGAQIIVIRLDGTRIIVGAVGKPDGTYRVENLPEGAYQIKENGVGHAARSVFVKAGTTASVDLAPSHGGNDK